MRIARLEDLTAGTTVRGLTGNGPATVVSVTWHNSNTIEVFYKDTTEAYCIRLAHLFDPLVAVHASLIRPLPHRITAIYDALLPRQPLRFLLGARPRGRIRTCWSSWPQDGKGPDAPERSVRLELAWQSSRDEVVQVNLDPFRQGGASSIGLTTVSKRLQIVVDDDEARRFEQCARADGLTLSSWARRVLRTAEREVSAGDPDRKLAAIRAAYQYAFPAPDTAAMLEDIERGYVAADPS